MAEQPVHFLNFLIPSPRLELRTLAGHTASSGMWRCVSKERNDVIFTVGER